MLDKARNNLIKHSFQLAGIVAPESDLTAEEIEDAAHTLNAMLQSWNNDGFRLFKIKTGYMPFVSGKNDYKLSTEAYKELASTNATAFYNIGATKLHVKDLSGISVGQKISIVSNSYETNEVLSIDYTNAIIELKTPTASNVNASNNVIFGDYNSAQTTIESKTTSFNTIKYTNASVAPVAGDSLMFSLNGSFITVTVSSVNAGNSQITFTPTQNAGSVDNSFIAFGDYVRSTKVVDSVSMGVRKITVENLDFTPVSLGLPAANSLSSLFTVERVSGNDIILSESIDSDILTELGHDMIFADQQYDTAVETTWTDFGSVDSTINLDWGSVTDTSSLETDDYGYVTESAEDLEDWQTLTGTASITSFAKAGNYSYVVAKNTTTNTKYLFYSLLESAWAQIDVTSFSFSDFSLFQTDTGVVLFDSSKGLYNINGLVLSALYTTNGIADIVKFNGVYYAISPKSGTLRTIISTSNFVSFSSSWTATLDSIANPAEFLGKLYIGTTNTCVTSDMKTFSNINVYSDNRCVVGDRLINLNTSRICTYTTDGETFKPMPMTLSNQSAWAYKDGCSFIGIYGAVSEGVVSTQIFTANDFNPTWTPQVIVKGRVSKIQFYEGKAYFVSDVQVVSLTYAVNTEADDVEVYYFGEQIGRPQEIMNVVKYSLTNSSRLPMTTMALKDYTLLPKNESGEPTTYCFFRDAEDGKMMLWGTPNKFGEYLEFSYVEPITLLEDARSTPDFPDEYYEAVEDGLAAELAYHYQLPVDRIQTLVAKAEASKELAMLHDNEDTSYTISPNQRGL